MPLRIQRVICVHTDIVDIKPANMEELTEVITAAEFHPEHCHLFVYSSSKGTLRLCDMRAQALCDSQATGTQRSFDSASVLHILSCCVCSVRGTRGSSSALLLL